MAQIFRDAAASTTTGVSVLTHTIVWSVETYETMLALLETGTTPEYDIGTYRCSTIDGIPLDPTEAAVSSLVSKIRRIIVDASSVVIEQGAARFFTGNTRTVVQLNSQTCIWPGCHIAATDCQADHLVEHSRGGRTNPGNGAPLCGRHNRHQHNAGYAIKRRPDSTYQITRPNGTLLS